MYRNLIPALLLAVAGSASATTDSISVNFIGGSIQDGADGALCYDTDTVPAGADGYAALHWQNLRGPNATAAQSYSDASNGDAPAGLVDGTGTTTAAFVDYAVNNTWRVLSYPSNDTERMRRGYLDSNGLGTVSITVSDVPYDTYDVIVYLSCDGNDRLGSVSVNGSAPIYYLTEAAGPGYIFGPLGQATATTAKQAVRSSYAVVTGVTGSTCEIAVSSENAGFNVGVAGFQIVEVAGDSCTGDLDGDGMVDSGDIGAFIAAWGTADVDADLDGNGMVDGFDLAYILGNWGACP